ncbi:MAG: nucleotidyltransferase domain-containing protein [Oscillospiraceae bacterium]|jgi:predicted nucleotidyltransferase|nr:nucleotidyltransferase domain-containing protein [Oscillospiraceae bacterium]
MFGLKDSHVSMIAQTLREAGIERAVVFGSRAKGNYRSNSDIDICVFGADVNVGKLLSDLDELPMPYKFDVVDYNTISTPALREQIDRVGVEIYK